MATKWGGGIFCEFATVKIMNCTIADNTALKRGGAIMSYYSAPKITNSILWGNAPSEIFVFYGPFTISYSDVQGGYQGINILDTDPRFVAGPLGDYYLSQFEAGQIDDNLPHGQSSDNPCVDAGNRMVGPLPKHARFGTTRTDGVPDSGMIDLGFHYRDHRMVIIPGNNLEGTGEEESGNGPELTPRHIQIN